MDIGVTLALVDQRLPVAVENLLPLRPHLNSQPFVIFFRTVSGHRPQDSGKSKLEEWVFVVIAGLGGSVLLTFWSTLELPCFSPFRGIIARNAGRIRSTFSRSSDLGIPGSLRLGIQRQVASRFSWISAGPRTRSVALAVGVNSLAVLTRLRGIER